MWRERQRRCSLRGGDAVGRRRSLAIRGRRRAERIGDEPGEGVVLHGVSRRVERRLVEIARPRTGSPGSWNLRKGPLVARHDAASSSARSPTSTDWAPIRRARSSFVSTSRPLGSRPRSASTTTSTRPRKTAASSSSSRWRARRRSAAPSAAEATRRCRSASIWPAPGN